MQVKKQRWETDMEQWTGSKLGKEYIKAVISLPCLFNLYAEYIMQNSGLDESQAGIKSAGRNINNLRYADDTTWMAESEEELKSLLMRVKEKTKKAGLKLTIQKTKITASDPITSRQIDGEKSGNSDRFYFLLFIFFIFFIFSDPKSLWMVTSAMKVKDSCSLEGKLWQTQTVY